MLVRRYQFSTTMAAITHRAGKWQIRVRHALLPKPFFSTFDDEDEARAYASQLETLLDRGIVPAELLEAEKRGADRALGSLLADYLARGHVAPTDVAVVELLAIAHKGVRVSHVTAKWADAWVARMKADEVLAPGTIRKRVGSLARALDWHWRTTVDGTPPGNPLRLMPRGYSQYAQDAPVRRVDAARDHRLLPDDEAAVRRSLAGEKQDGKERPLVVSPELVLLFEIILHTGMRLREAYTLRVDQIDWARWVIRVDGTKGERGRLRPRSVPVVRVLRPLLQAHCAGRAGLLFPGLWDGSPESKTRASGRLSQRFATLFAYAGVENFTEHDLRHHATCLWFELRYPDGRWIFSEIEICKIMGWTDTKMVVRYASLRGEDLSSRLIA